MKISKFFFAFLVIATSKSYANNYQINSEVDYIILDTGDSLVVNENAIIYGPRGFGIYSLSPVQNVVVTTRFGSLNRSLMYGISLPSAENVSIEVAGRMDTLNTGIYLRNNVSSSVVIKNTSIIESFYGADVTGSIDTDITAESGSSIIARAYGLYGHSTRNLAVRFDGTINSDHSGVIATSSEGIVFNSGNASYIYGEAIGLYGWDDGTYNLLGQLRSSGPAFILRDRNQATINGTLAGNQAIFVTGSSNVLTIESDALIIGNIVSNTGETDNTLRFNVGSAQSFVFATSGNWTLQDLDGRAVVAGSAMAAGIGNAETADELMSDRSMSLDSSLARLERQSSFGERQALFDAYGFSQSRDEDGTTSAYELDSRGMTIGLPLELLGNQAIAFVNYHDSEIDVASGTHDIDARSLRFGLSVPQMWSGENYNIGIYAVTGRNSYDGTRDVLVNQNTTTGITTIDASWDSTELEIGADVTSNMALASKLTLDSSLGLAAQVERIGSYAEENYFAWDSRTIVQAHAKAEVTLGYQATDTTRIYGTAGAWRRDVRSGETSHYTINNTAVSYYGGVYDDTISSLRIGLGHRLGNGAVISAEASAIDGGTADRSYGASLGVAARF